MRAFVYYNLHKHCWSIRSAGGSRPGIVIAHASEVLIEQAIFRVGQAGRDRVVATRQKNVHAGVVGDIVSLTDPTWRHSPPLAFNELYAAQVLEDFLSSSIPIDVSYNPYTAGHFYIRSTNEAIHESDLVLLRGDRTVTSFTKNIC